jgi:Leucine-rich repeat (LRR) protein
MGAALASMRWLPAQAQNVTVFNPALVIPARGERLVQFPKDYSLGELYIVNNGQDPAVMNNQLLSGAARGAVKVPAGKVVTLKAGRYLFKNPGVVNTLPPDALDSLKLWGYPMDDSNVSQCDSAMKFVSHLKGLAALSLDRSDATDAGMACAAQLSQLQMFSAAGTAVTGASLKQLGPLKKLKVLRLSGDVVKEENFQYLTQFPALQYLDLSHVGLSEAGLKYIGLCGQIVALDISTNKLIDDQSIKHLLRLKKLSCLTIRGTSISVKGVLQLKALPLKLIVLPGSHYKKEDLDVLKKALPRVEIIMPANGPVDSDTKQLYAPLH